MIEYHLFFVKKKKRISKLFFSTFFKEKSFSSIIFKDRNSIKAKTVKNLVKK